MSRECETLCFFRWRKSPASVCRAREGAWVFGNRFSWLRVIPGNSRPVSRDSPGRFGDWLESRGLPFHVVEDINGCDDFLFARDAWRNGNRFWRDIYLFA